MCGPAAIAAVQFGVQATSTIASAEAQDKHARAAWANADTDLMNKYTAVQSREQQEIARAGLEVFQAQKAGTSNASRIRAQLASGGIAGASAQEREAQPGIAVAEFASTTKINLANQLRQEQADAASFKAQAQSVINENQPVSGLSVGLQLGEEAISQFEKAKGSNAPGGQGGGD